MRVNFQILLTFDVGEIVITMDEELHPYQNLGVEGFRLEFKSEWGWVTMDEAYQRHQLPDRLAGFDPGRGGLPDCAVRDGDLAKGSPLEQAAQSVAPAVGVLEDLKETGGRPFDRSSCRSFRNFETENWGSLVLGDWIQLISPTMRDLSATSWRWWEEVVQLAMAAYREWLRAEPVQRLHIKTQVPRECATVWNRLEPDAPQLGPSLHQVRDSGKQGIELSGHLVCPLQEVSTRRTC